jgi:Cu(I)/Ag(I) efflux system membrane fusion protein
MITGRWRQVGGVLIAFGGVVLAACGSPAPASTGGPALQPPAAKPTASAGPASNAQQVLDAYERVRSELAADKVEATTESSAALQRAATAAASSGGASQQQLQQVAASAQKLQEMPKTDANEVRKVFGDVSAAVVGLAAVEPSLQSGKNVFECPMAQGYKKWIQPGESVSNPYMGKAMLECGSKSSWQ